MSGAFSVLHKLVAPHLREALANAEQKEFRFKKEPTVIKTAKLLGPRARA